MRITSFVTFGFKHAFLTFFWRFLTTNNSNNNKSNWKKLLEFRNLQEKLEKSCFYFQMLEGHIPNVHVHSMMIGNSAEEDTLNGFFMSVDHQIEIACDRIKQYDQIDLN